MVNAWNAIIDGISGETNMTTEFTDRRKIKGYPVLDRPLDKIPAELRYLRAKTDKNQRKL